jgi:hypothetical protein
MLRAMRISSGVSAFALGLSLLTGACLAASHGPAKVQETAMDMNVHCRFGRMELATEMVAPKARKEFLEHRRGWGGRVRIADTELAGLHMVDDDNSEVTVKVAWYDMSLQELHVTTLQQKWHAFSGDWKLTKEARTDGEPGLLGDAIEPSAQPSGDAPKPRNASFPTVHLGGGAEPKADPAPEPATTAAAEP